MDKEELATKIDMIENLKRRIIDEIKASRFCENGDGRIYAQLINNGDGISIATRFPEDPLKSNNGGDYYHNMEYRNTDAGILSIEQTSCEMVEDIHEVVLENVNFKKETWNRLIKQAINEVKEETLVV